VFDGSTLTLTCLDTTNVSVCWFSLSSLENMELRDNVLKTLPSSMASLTKLRVLDLGSNLLEDLVSRLAYALPAVSCPSVSSFADIIQNLSIWPGDKIEA